MARFTRLRRARVSLSYETKLPMLAGAAAVPALGIALLLLWREPWPTGLRLALTLFGIFPPVLTVMMLRDRITFPLRTITNLLAALREGDYSLRAGRQGRLDALGEVMQEINYLGDLLSNHAQKSAEATALLRGVLAEIDLAVFTFDEQNLLQLVNRAGARLLAKAEHRLLGQPASRLGLEKLLLPGSPAIVSDSFPGAAGTRWSVRRSTFREGGRPHQLLVIADVSLALREEERLAWQRLIRVLGHELNNSLGPMRSIADTLLATTQRLVVRLDPEDFADLDGGLQIIRDRADALSRFMEAYGQLAKLPAPRPGEEVLGTLVSHVAALPADKRIQLIPGPDLRLWVDRV